MALQRGRAEQNGVAARARAPEELHARAADVVGAVQLLGALEELHAGVVEVGRGDLARVDAREEPGLQNLGVENGF